MFESIRLAIRFMALPVAVGTRLKRAERTATEPLQSTFVLAMVPLSLRRLLQSVLKSNGPSTSAGGAFLGNAATRAASIARVGQGFRASVDLAGL